MPRQRTVLIRPNDELIDSRYLHYRLMAPAAQAWMRARAEGSTVAHLNVSDVRQLPLDDLPDLEGQRRVASALVAFDDLADGNESLVRQLEQLVADLFAAAQFDSIPDTATTLSELVEINPKRPKPAGTAAYIDMAALPTSSARVRTVARRPAQGGARFMNGDTLMARITPCLENGKTAFVDVLGDEEVGIGSTEFIVLRSRPPLPPAWTYFLARSPRFRDYVVRHMTGSSGRQRCPAEAVARYPIAVPDSEALRSFAEAVDPLMAAMRDLDEEAQAARRSRDELLPVIFAPVVAIQEVAA